MLQIFGCASNRLGPIGTYWGASSIPDVPHPPSDDTTTMSSIKETQPTVGSDYPGHESHHVTLATAAIEEEKRLGFKAVFRLYYKAAIWSALLSTALVMEGYDIGIVSELCLNPLRRPSLEPDLLGRSTLSSVTRRFRTLLDHEPTRESFTSRQTGNRPSTMPPPSVKSSVSRSTDGLKLDSALGPSMSLV